MDRSRSLNHPTLTRAWTLSQRRCDPTSSSSHRPRSPRPWWSRPLSLSETASLQLSRPFVILLPLVLILLLLTLWRSTLSHSPTVSTLIQNIISTIFQHYFLGTISGVVILKDKQTRRLRIYVYSLDKAPRLSISIVIWILSSDTDICQLNQFNTNSEAAMLSNIRIQYMMEV